jgi:hypothetical protein
MLKNGVKNNKQKADNGNKAKIGSVYPEYIEAYNIWFQGEY